MEHCETCVYPAKCELRGRCLTGDQAVEAVQAEPAKEEAPKTVKKKKAK